MTHSDTQPSMQDVALIVGGGPGIGSSCARLFAENGMRVAVAARTPDKPVLQTLEKTHDVRVAGIFRKGITEADPSMVLETLRNAAFSAFLAGQQAVRLMPIRPFYEPW